MGETTTTTTESPYVANPYGYGYVSSLNETRSQDAIDILTNERMLLALGAITGVSLIVFGILITSSTQVKPK